LAFSQNYRSGYIDTVYSFTPGTGQNAGQDSAYFPLNIFGPPSERATRTIAETSPEQILSIGMGGEIIVGFKDMIIIDGPGADFTVFENVFEILGINKKYVEPAVVSVSRDGHIWHSFPFDSLTLIGCAGNSPTIGNQDPFNPQRSGGDSFDLADLQIDSVRYIKITDITHILIDTPNHPYFDPTLSGFDLDAIAGIHLASSAVSVKTQYNEPIVNVNDNWIEFIGINGNFQLSIFDYSGAIRLKQNIDSDIKIDIADFYQGFYILQLSDLKGNINIIKKIIKI